ncbi:MAG: radical SAM protein, partial [Endomicrobiaceae bacterium]|nr:radical SAM protein [Endomicrobiaceae bacterium]
MKNLFSLTTLNLIKTTCISMIKDYPMFCRLELTSKCNFRCEFCHIHRKNNIKSDMTTDQVITVIDALAKAGVSFLYVTGGEPLIREDVIEILKYAKKKNMYILLGTNGSFLLKKFDKIYKYIDNIHLSVQTISKFKEITGSTKENFIDICESIKLLISKNIPTQINIPIDKNNINEMLDIFKFINKSFPNI